MLLQKRNSRNRGALLLNQLFSRSSSGLPGQPPAAVGGFRDKPSLKLQDDFRVPNRACVLRQANVVLTRSDLRLHRSQKARAARGSAIARSTPRVITSPEARSRGRCAVMLHAAFGAAAGSCRRPSDASGLTCLAGFPTGSITKGCLRVACGCTRVEQEDVN